MPRTPRMSLVAVWKFTTKLMSHIRTVYTPRITLWISSIAYCERIITRREHNITIHKPPITQHRPQKTVWELHTSLWCHKYTTYALYNTSVLFIIVHEIIITTMVSSNPTDAQHNTTDVPQNTTEAPYNTTNAFTHTTGTYINTKDVSQNITFASGSNMMVSQNTTEAI